MIRGLLACLAAIAPVGVPEAARTNQAEPATLRLHLPERAQRKWISYEAPRNTITFAAVMNGRAVTVLLDNGADRTLIDRTFAMRAGVAVRGPTSRALTGALTQIETVATDPVVIEVDRAFRVAGPMVAMDLSPVARALGRSIDVVMGRDVLDEFSVMIDPVARHLYFDLGGRVQAGPGTTVLPIGEDMTVAAQLDGQRVVLKLDLGSNGVIRLSDAAWARVVPTGTPTSEGSQTTADGMTRVTKRAGSAFSITLQVRPGTEGCTSVPAKIDFRDAAGVGWWTEDNRWCRALIAAEPTQIWVADARSSGKKRLMIDGEQDHTARSSSPIETRPCGASSEAVCPV